MTAALRKTIFAGCRTLGLDEDTRRDLQLVATGKASMTDMTEDDLKKVLAELKKRGFNPVSKPGSRRRFGQASRADLRLIHVLWKKLGETGALDNPTRDGLNAFIRRRFEEKWCYVPRDVDDLREHAEIDDVIQALKAWCRRAGADVDWGEIGR